MPGIGFVRRPAGKQEMLPGRQKGKILMEDFSRDHTVREKPGQTDCNSAAEKGSAEISVCGTPVCDFIRAYQAQNVLRLHMPGHKGQGFPEALDVTEIRGLDPLYPAAGVILESEKNAAALFGSGRTVYSAEGSSLCIRAMLFLARMRAERLGIRPLILAGRNAHRTFLSAAALLGLEVRWLKGENLLTCRPSAEAVAAALDEPCDGEDACGSPEDRRSREDYPVREQPRPCLEEDGALPSSAFAAVYLTSPDYLGHRADIRAVAAVCRRRGVPLLVDNAHGAYLKFMQPDRHPITLGADACYIATAALLALGCHLCRTCQTGKCNWGIATQRPDLVKRLNPDMGSERLINLMTAWRHEIMELMGGMGINSIEALRGNRLMLRGVGLTEKELQVLGIKHAGE